MKFVGWGEATNPNKKTTGPGLGCRYTNKTKSKTTKTTWL